MFRCRVLLLCLAVSLAAHAFAQTATASLTKDPQAMTVAARALMAMGGQQTIPDSTKADYYRAATKTTYTVDPITGLINSVEIMNFAQDDPNSGVPEKVSFSDYRQAIGLLVPFHQTGYMNGKLQFDITLDSVAFNVGVPDSDFALPAGVANAQ